MLAAICVTILTTSGLKCDIGPEVRVSQLLDKVVSGQVLVIDPNSGEMLRASAPFIVREDDLQWQQVLLMAKMPDGTLSKAHP